jgi:hypothetical protein
LSFVCVAKDENRKREETSQAVPRRPVLFLDVRCVVKDAVAFWSEWNNIHSSDIVAMNKDNCFNCLWEREGRETT